MDSIEFIKQEIKDEIARLEKLEQERLKIKDYAGALERSSEREGIMRVWQIVCNSQSFEKPSKEQVTARKFKAGDFVVSPLSVTWHITDVNLNYYQVERIDRKEYSYFKVEDERLWRLWEINDSKDGDVLVYPDNCLTIFNYKYFDSGLFMSHLIYTGRNIETGRTCAILNAKPATLDQRSFLFFKIYELGYKWNAKDKVIEKILKPYEWKKSDLENLERAIKNFDTLGGNRNSICYTLKEMEYRDLADWLKSIREKIK